MSRHRRFARLALGSAWAMPLAIASWGCSSAPTASVRRPLAVHVAPDGPPNAKAVLEPVTERARTLGASPMVLVAAGIGSEGERVGAFVDLPKATCLLVTAAGSPGVGDVDLFAFDDDGTAAGADESPAAAAVVMICPPHPDRLYLSARLVSGGGVVSIGMQEVPPDKAHAIAVAVGARGGGDETGRLDSWPGLEAKVRDHRAQLGSRWEDIRRLAAPLDPRAPTRTTIAIEPGRCIDVLVTPSDEVSSLDVVAETEDGRIAARAQTEGRDRTMVLCTATGESLTIAMRPRIAQGLAAVIVGRSARGAEGEIAHTVRIDRTSQSLDLGLAEKSLETELAGGAYGATQLVGKGDAKVGSRAGLSARLRQGCSPGDVVAGAPLGPLDAAIWSDQGTLVSEGKGGAKATLFACGASSNARIDVEAEARPGPFAIELRPFKASPPELVAHPLAAGRILRKLDDEDADVTDVGGLRELNLAHASLAKEVVNVKQGTCREVIAAVDAKGSGIELRLVDELTKTDSIVRARFAVSNRVCAGNLAKQVTAELRLTNGEGAALLLSREVPVE